MNHQGQSQVAGSAPEVYERELVPAVFGAWYPCGGSPPQGERVGQSVPVAPLNQGALCAGRTDTLNVENIQYGAGWHLLPRTLRDRLT